MNVVDRAGLLIGLGLAFAGCGAAALVVFSERAAATAQRMARLAPLTSVQRVTSALTDAVSRYAHHHGELIRVLSMSIARAGGTDSPGMVPRPRAGHRPADR